MKQILHKPYAFFLLVLVLSLVSIIPLVHPGYISTDDGTWMVVRFSAFHQALIHGQIPPRFLPRLNFEYGYPVADFLYPGFMYLAEPIHFLKISFVNTIKILFALSLITSALFTYLWLSKHVQKFAAFVGAIIALYSPYHLIDTYARGSIGEVLALAVMPGILWMIDSDQLVLTSLGIGILLLSHNTLAALLTPIILLYMLLHWFEKPTTKKLFLLLSAFCLGIGLATFFWLPALNDLHNTVFSHTKIADWQQHFASTGEVGMLNIALFLLGIIGVFFLGKRHIKRRFGIFFLVLTAFALFFSLPLSSFLWQVVPASFIQFPFRLLSLEIIGIAYLTAFCLDLIRPPQKFTIGWIICILAMLFAIPVLAHVHYLDEGEGFYTTNEDTTTVKNEYMPKWITQHPQHRPDQKITATQAEISNLLDKTNKIFFTAYAQQNTVVTVNLIYFPGWKAKIDGKPAEIRYNNPMGLIQLPVSKGTHTAEVYFTETPFRLFADCISLVSFAVIGIIALVQRKGMTKPKRRKI